MKWSENNLMWGRPLRSILAIFNKKLLAFTYGHLRSKDFTVVEQDLETKYIKIKNFNEYQLFLKKNNITLDQNERERKILRKFETICKSKKYKEIFDKKLLEEVVNITENPNVLLIDFDRKYLDIPSEIIISTLQNHQKYFPLFDYKEKLTNHFHVVANNIDKKNLIK
jgi:glycyl-tRNA synthetase beta chain